MKKIIAISIGLFLLSSCHKKKEAPDFDSLIIRKWSCDSYKEDNTDTIVNNKPYSLSSSYEYGWEFFVNKQIRFKNGIGWQDKPEPNSSYVLSDNKILTLTLNATIYEFDILELSTNKLTVHSNLWKKTYYLLTE